MEFYRMKNNPEAVNLNAIPVLEYSLFYEQTAALLRKKEHHVLNYFIHGSDSGFRFIILIAGDDTHTVYVYSHLQDKTVQSLKSLTPVYPPVHIFEREIYETYGIAFSGHPWLKPVRYPAERSAMAQGLNDYPFYSIESEEVHEVGVGPVHAGVIEPGHFRFICHGEKVLHLEIQLGYQHRGVEKLFAVKNNLLKQSLLSESIAGDTSVGHSLAFSQMIEALSATEPSVPLQIERTIALEMERMAVHVGDTAALCGDVGYQLGQSACEAIRTMIINTTQDWCGNRFGKGLVRPGGTNYPLTPEMIDAISESLGEIKRRFLNVTDLVYNNTGIISRFENTGTVSETQARMTGAVGMAARASGLNRDIRASHPFQAFKKMHYTPARLESGDVFARGLIRKVEFELSCQFICKLLAFLKDNSFASSNLPDYKLKLKPEWLGISLVEGWRGEICHCTVTGEDGAISSYKIKDPSLHNWMILALAVRGEEISDFPLCNKSFNLSYCGHDL